MSETELTMPLMSEPEWMVENALLGISAELWHREHAPSREAFLALGLPIWDGLPRPKNARKVPGPNDTD
jgi:hypothetical protein